MSSTISPVALWSVNAAVQTLRAGRPVVLSDRDRSRGDLVYPAETINARQMAHLVQLTSGLVQVALPDSVCDKLLLPAMAGAGRYGSQPCVAVDSISTGTGISATDRATTARALVGLTSTADSFTRPGHVIPIRVPEPAELHEPDDYPAAAVALIDRAGLRPGAVMAALVDTSTGHDLAAGNELEAWACHFGYTVVAAEDITRHVRRRAPHNNRRSASAPVAMRASR